MAFKISDSKEYRSISLPVICLREIGFGAVDKKSSWLTLIPMPTMAVLNVCPVSSFKKRSTQRIHHAYEF